MEKVPLRSISMILIFLAVLPVLHGQRKITLTGVEDILLSQICEYILMEAYDQIGVELIITPYPRVQSLETSNEGRTDGELFRIDGIEKIYTNLLKIPVPIYWVEGTVFTKDTDLIVTGWESLAPYRVGVQRGIKFIEDGLNTVPDLVPMMVEDSFQLFRILEAGRVDLAVSSRLTGLSISGKLGFTEIRPLSPPLSTFPVFHYLHRKNADLLPRITAVLEEMESRGRFDEIEKMFLVRRFGP